MPVWPPGSSARSATCPPYFPCCHTINADLALRRMVCSFCGSLPFGKPGGQKPTDNSAASVLSGTGTVADERSLDFIESLESVCDAPLKTTTGKRGIPMDLETCPDCSQPISQRARICVHCGAPMFRPTGTDKGFHLLYWGLSYRRKFLRTLWILCLTPLLLLVPERDGFHRMSSEFWFVTVLITGVAQLIYTYVMWRNVEGG